jgi:hypothetical protein
LFDLRQVALAPEGYYFVIAFPAACRFDDGIATGNTAGQTGIIRL